MQKGSAQIFLCFLGLAIILGGLYLYTKNQKLEQQNIFTPMTEVISNIQTYTNSQLGFEFAYAKDLKAKDDSEEDFNKRGNGDFRKNFKDYVTYEPGKFVGAALVLGKNNSYETNPFSVWIFDNPENLSIDAWYKNYWYYPFVWGDYTSMGKITLAPKDEATVSGQMGKSGIIDYQPGKPKFIYLSKDKKMYLFRIIGSDGDKILSTFKFIDQSSSQKLKKCPDEWIVNKMPGTADIKETTSREFFVIDSKRRELAEFDIGWIKSNCSVKEPSPVY